MISSVASIILSTLTQVWAQAGVAPGVATPDGGAPSQEPPRLETVTVSGRSLDDTLPEELSRAGTRVTTISAGQIENGGYVDVAQSLEALAPGLYISPKNGPFDYVGVSLQGSRTQDVLWLVDGVRINNRLYGGTTPLDTLPASIVDRLEIVEGPQALFFGTQAVAGAINIVTRAFADGPGGSIGVGADTNGGRHLDAFLRDGLGPHRVVFYAAADQSQGFQPYRDQDYQPSATDRRRGYDVLTLGGKYGYDFSDALRFSALYQHTDASLDFAMPFLVERAYNQRDEDIASAKLDYAPTPTLRLYARGYAHWWRSHYTELDNVVSTPGTLGVVDDYDFWGYKDYGGNAMAKLSIADRLEAFLGYDVQRYGGNDVVLVIAQKTESVNAFFAQLRSAPGWLHDGSVAAGLRYNLPSFGPAAVVWSASGQYDPTRWLFARATVGTAFRLPTAEELFANDPNDERGDPNLRPEKSFNVNLSIGGRIGRQDSPSLTPGLTWEAIGFYRTVNDLISASGFDPGTNQSLFENTPGTVHVRGATVAIDGRLSAAVSSSVSYTYAAAERTGGMQLDGVPRQQAKAWLDVHPANVPIGATLTATYAGASYRTFGDDDRERLDGHAVVDLVGRIFLDPRRRHTINLRLSNVFNAVYATALGKAVRDSDGSDYTYWSLGVPRTFEARYRYQF